MSEKKIEVNEDIGNDLTADGKLVAAVELGRLGGKVKSNAKTEACKKNGLKNKGPFKYRKS